MVRYNLFELQILVISEQEAVSHIGIVLVPTLSFFKEL